ncbi:hypothetical protein Z517_01102 [Fonsecaea pedrosoi CBS 271.37]|uniref:Uncharacterized protein n=1 Tax=Fonsecaea pedrosoi CBS 271.37 TaxID=1442368 RepID=A0A0D2H490_9EURO|nr:uncharacterized protein Z517_01102 [Fonsecaea pedrosoi CBS 271.37]KIW85710.1 hypothetical protein Z517_01102 [Fonsecaea pedrosoi CBS 271.37]
MGNSYSTPADITSRDMQRWRRDGRPVLVDQQRRRQSPGGRYRDERNLRIVRDNSRNRFESDDTRWWGGSSGWHHRRDGASPPLRTGGRSTRRHTDAGSAPAFRARPDWRSADDMFGGAETVYHGWQGGSRFFERGGRAERRTGSAVVVEEEDWFGSAPQRFTSSRGSGGHRSMPQSSFRGPWWHDAHPHDYRGGQGMPRRRSNTHHGGAYMSGGLGRGDPMGGAWGGQERAPERGRVGFRPDWPLLGDGRADD